MTVVGHSRRSAAFGHFCLSPKSGVMADLLARTLRASLRPNAMQQRSTGAAEGRDPSGALQPTPYARAVSTVDITELAFEIDFLAAIRRA